MEDRPFSLTDLSYLYKFSKGNRKFISSMKGLFPEQMPENIIDLRKAVKNEAIEDIKTVLNKLKHIYLLFGISKGCELCSKLELELSGSFSRENLLRYIKELEVLNMAVIKELQISEKN